MMTADTTQLRAAVSKCKSAVDRKDWAAAVREADKLGAVWAKFKPGKAGTMSATEMKNFDANYAKLQKDCRARNTSGAESAARALLDTVNKMQR